MYDGNNQGVAECLFDEPPAGRFQTVSENEEIGPATRYRHDHPPVRNPLEEHEEGRRLGQRVADRVAAAVGSWPFIIVQSILLLLWMGANIYLAVMERVHPGFLKAWDPYPFILLNLVLSFQAAYTGPVVMMSQNRQNEKDRLMAENDYQTNQRAEEEIRVVMEHLGHQDQLLLRAIARLDAMHPAAPEQPAVEDLRALFQRMEERDRRLIAILERMEERGGATPL